MITYRPNFIEPDVLEKIERDRRNKETEIRNRPMEDSIQKFNPDYHFADFEYVYVPHVSPHREGVENHNVLDMDITAHNKAEYYKKKIPEFLPKITTTITTTPTTSHSERRVRVKRSGHHPGSRVKATTLSTTIPRAEASRVCSCSSTVPPLLMQRPPARAVQLRSLPWNEKFYGYWVCGF